MEIATPEFAQRPLPLCAWCTELITEGEMDSAHVHHDVNTCDFFPFDEDEWEILNHELTCPHQLFYHQNCCRKCSAQMAGV